MRSLGALGLGGRFHGWLAVLQIMFTPSLFCINILNDIISLSCVPYVSYRRRRKSNMLCF